MSQVTETLESPDAPQAHRIWGRLALLLLLAGILVLLSWVGLKAWRVYQASSSLLARQSEAEQLLAAGWRQAEPDQLETLVLGTRSDLLSLERELGPMVPLLPLLSGLPRIGPLAESAPHLLEMADAGMGPRRMVCAALSPRSSNCKIRTKTVLYYPSCCKPSPLLSPIWRGPRKRWIARSWHASK
jgi:hypothetical protein